MVQVYQPPKGGLVKAWIDGVAFEDTARVQVVCVKG